MKYTPSNIPKIHFTIGVNGVGKTSIIPYLNTMLGEGFAIHDFDERGVPDNAGGEWRRSETKHWIETGKRALGEGISTIISGYSKPEEILTAADEVGVPVSIILLDADAETITNRILGRYPSQESLDELERTTGKTPEKFAADNVWVSSKFRETAIDAGFKVIDTSVLTPEEVAQRVVDHIRG